MQFLWDAIIHNSTSLDHCILFLHALLHFTSRDLHNLQLIWKMLFAKIKENKQTSFSAVALFSTWKAIDPMIFFHIHPSRFILEKKITRQKSYHLVSVEMHCHKSHISYSEYQGQQWISMKVRGENIAPDDETTTTNHHNKILLCVSCWDVFFSINVVPKTIGVHVVHTCIMKQIREKPKSSTAVIHP